MTLLSQLKAALEAATPMPWDFINHNGEGYWICNSARTQTLNPRTNDADASLICLAVNSLAALVATIEAADRFVYLRKTSHDGDEIHSALHAFYEARARLEGAPK